MDVGIVMPCSALTPPDLIAETAKAIEERGFAAIWAPEHVIFFEEYQSKYPYADHGKLLGFDHGMMEPWTTLSFVASNTSRVKLGSSICLVPQRNPVYTAKQIADVDFLSNGRVIFGVGAGWLKEEFDALGVPFERRGARCREYLEVIGTLWADDVSSFSGNFYELPPCRQYPKPIQRPGPPIYFGGESTAALRRVADMGQGWYGFNVAPEDVAGYLERLDGLLAENGRSRSEIEVVIGPYGHKLNPERARQYQDAGVDQLVGLIVGRDLDELERWLDRLAEYI